MGVSVKMGAPKQTPRYYEPGSRDSHKGPPIVGDPHMSQGVYLVATSMVTSYPQEVIITLTKPLNILLAHAPCTDPLAIKAASRFMLAQPACCVFFRLTCSSRLR